MLPSHPLIEAIVKPHEDNAEMKLSAIKILEETFDPDHPSVPQAIQRLNAQEKKKFPALSKILIWSLAAAALGFSVYANMPSIKAIILYQRISDFNFPQLALTLPEGLTEKERLLIGDPEFDDLYQKQQLFESDPSYPAYFFEYAQAFDLKSDRLPPDFLEIASRIDPENSFFLYWAAAKIGKDAVENIRSKKSSSTPRYVDGVRLPALPSEAEYNIKDQAAYDEALSLIHKASGLPNFENYQMDMLKARSGIIPTDNFGGYIHSMMVIYGTSAHGVMSLAMVSKIMAARAEELSKKGRRDEFLALVSQCDVFLSRWSKSKDIYLVNELVYAVVASGISLNFQAAAERLGLTEMAEIYRKQNDLFAAERDRRCMPNDPAIEKLLQERSSILARLSIPMIERQAATPPPLTDADLKPLRMVEHELLGHIGIFSIALLLIPLAAVVFFFRFLTTQAVRLPAKRIATLLKFSDWIWIFSFGIALPIFIFLYISRLSPVSGRDYGSSYFLLIFPGLHLSALLLTLLLAPAIITRWRLTRRAAAFKFGSRWDLLSLPVIGVMLVYAIVAYPVLVHFKLNIYTQIGLAAPLLGWLGFVFFNGLRIFLGSARSRLIQSATAMAVIPAYPLAIICLCLTLPLYHQGEKYWLPKDKLHLIDPDAPDLGAYEFKVAAQKRKETNAILGY